MNIPSPLSPRCLPPPCRAALLFLLALLSCGTSLSAAAPADAKVLRGTLKNPLDGSRDTTLGSHGARVFRSAAQWEHFLDTLKAAGWEQPAVDPLGKTDFQHEMIGCVLQYGDEGNAFRVRNIAGDAAKAELEVVMSYIIYKKRGEPVDNWKFICVALPQAPQAKVSVFTYHPMNGGPYPTPEKALLEWTTVLGPDTGDNVGNLRGSIQAKAKQVKAGEDVLLTFTLQFANGSVGKNERFASLSEAACVWDGKYSNGYRNHAFLVTTPDGKSQVLRPKVIDQWDKNAPHMVKIEAGKDYVLPEWVEGTPKSLKALGLDTRTPGTYRITGIYAESAASGLQQPGGNGNTPWGGELFTNTIEVEVR